MITNVKKQDLIEELAKDMKDKVAPPVWAQFVKTGAGKQRPPQRNDWWYVRTASVLLKVNDLGPVGVSKLSVKYGNKKNNGSRPETFKRGSRSIIRKVLQQLEDEELVKQDERGVHKGRMITKKGLALINDTAKKMVK